MEDLIKKNINNKYFLWGGITSVIGFVLTAYILFKGSLFSKVDSAVNGFFISLQNSTITKLMIGFDFITGEFIFAGLVLLVSGIFFYKKAHKEAFLLAIPMFIGGILVKITKDYFEVARPTFVPGDIVSSFAFPSGHTTLSFLFFILMGYLLYKGIEKQLHKNLILVGFVMLTLLTVFNRLYLGVHWFSDVLAGIFLGSSVSLIALYIYTKS